MDALADTCFFIDLQRNINGAAKWLECNPGARILASVVTFGELAAGFESRPALEERFAGIPLVAIDIPCAWIAGQVARKLRGEGRMIGANDLWIAASALQADLPVLTRNRDEFMRVDGLALMLY